MKMEENSSRNSSDLESLSHGITEESQLQTPELESPDSDIRKSLCVDQQFDSMSAMEILRETVRILRYDPSSFMVIAAILICPVSAVVLSGALIDQSMVKKLTFRFLTMSQSSGLPLRHFVKQLCQRLSEMVISSVFCFPLYTTFSLLSKSAIVYSVDCTYSRKKFVPSKFFAIFLKIWRCLVSTYLWICLVIIGCVALFIVVLITICNVFTLLGFSSDLIIYPAILVGLIFSVIFANVVIICNLAVVVSVLEDLSGPRALLRSSVLIQGKTQVGLMIFLGSTMGMAFLEGLFDHRVKTVSYGDGSSRIWEGPLLVIMYSFVVLIDYMMSSVFYFTCRFSNVEDLDEDGRALVDVMAPSQVLDI